MQFKIGRLQINFRGVQYTILSLVHLWLQRFSDCWSSGHLPFGGCLAHWAGSD